MESELLRELNLIIAMLNTLERQLQQLGVTLSQLENI